MEFKKKYPCTQCIFLTTKESTLAKHMIRHQNVSEDERVSKSSSPPSSAISAAMLGSSSLPKALESSISKETNLSVEKFKCKDCERVFNSYQGVSHHTKSKHEGIKYACNQCNYQGTTQQNLTVHIQSKHEGVKYACNQCDHQATSQRNLRYHIQSKHEGVKYVCDQ